MSSLPRTHWSRLRDLRLVDSSDRFIRLVPEQQVSKLLELGRISLVGAGRKRKLVANGKVSDFEGCNRPGNAASSTTYIERIEGAGPLTMLRRYDRDQGIFRAWPEDMTFEQLRAA